MNSRIRTIVHTARLAALAAVASLASTAAAAGPELVSVAKIWDAGKHNAFTDLIRWHDKWYCTFREADDHVGAEPASLESLRGKPVVLYFWWEACGDCKMQADVFRRTVEKYQPKGVAFVAPRAGSA